jgi:hypothetical protein
LQRNGFFGRSHFCAGSIADASNIITAAHCLEEYKQHIFNFHQEKVWFYIITTRFTLTTIYRLHPIGVWAVAGEYRLDLVSGVEQELRAAHFFMHEEYDPNYLKNDIGIMRLNGAFVFNSILKQVKLPGRDYFTHPGTAVTVAGWGTTKVRVCIIINKRIQVLSL